MSDTLTDSIVLDPAGRDLLFTGARSARYFSAEPVTDATVRAVYELAKWAPTSLNQQPLRVVLIRTPEARERLIRHLDPGNRAKARSAPLTVILACDLRFHEHLPRLLPYAPDAGEQFAADPAAGAESAVFNATLQAGFFILAVRAAGLSAGPLAGFDEGALDREFFPDGRHRTLLVLNVGRPDDDTTHPRLPRLSYDEVVTTL